jgi:uncharacterized protein YndB with AHSA1/START domain
MSVVSEAGTEFAIVRILDAPRTAVFDAWIDPAHLAQWWGARGFTAPVCELDPVPGGAWRVVMRSPDGAEYSLGGRYLDVSEPERLAMTIDRAGAAGGIFVNLDPLDGRTKLAIRMRFATPAGRDAMAAIGLTDGWSQSLERLAILLARAS